MSQGNVTPLTQIALSPFEQLVNVPLLLLLKPKEERHRHIINFCIVFVLLWFLVFCFVLFWGFCLFFLFFANKTLSEYYIAATIYPRV